MKLGAKEILPPIATRLLPVLRTLAILKNLHIRSYAGARIVSEQSKQLLLFLHRGANLSHIISGICDSLAYGFFIYGLLRDNLRAVLGVG